ncbi:MAG: CoA pyrophosphatase [Butyrivibrio sp.]|nr:CoA pyrophosphatase [Butyrivibrio sp.]
MNISRYSKGQLKTIIEKNNASRTDIPAGSSAVLIPIVEKDGELHIVFEERSHSLKFQPGDVCFPGGKVEGNESPKNCAIRECLEELFPNGTDESYIEIIAALPPMVGPTGNNVYPFVGFLNNYNFTYSKDEVEQVITYPISFFENNPPLCYPMEKHTVAPSDFPADLVSNGRGYKPIIQKYDMYIYDKTSPVIWGFTGRLLHIFTNMLHNSF